MSLKILFVVLISVFSCQKKEIFSKEKLIGKWESFNKNQSPIILEINENAIYRLENGKKIIYHNYSVSKDTLIMINTKFKEKHIIEILTSNKLRFGAINPRQKDIELIDAVEFIKQ